MKMRILKLAVLGAGFLAIAAGLCFFYPLMRPIQEGSSADFWYFACRVDIGSSKAGCFGGTYPGQDGWFVYYVQGYHGQALYRLKREDALADWPKVLDNLRRADQEGNSSNSAFTRMYRSWPLARPGGDSADELPAHVREARLEWAKERGEESYQLMLAEEKGFEERWARAGRYWVNVLFEFVFLGAVLIFLLWPWLRRKGAIRWILHVGFTPLLLFLPMYLGYAEWSGTCVGPSGGVLYPWVTTLLPDCPWTMSEAEVVAAIPKVLEPISQLPGPMISFTGGTRTPSPLMLLMIPLWPILIVGLIACLRHPGRLPRRTKSSSGTAHPPASTAGGPERKPEDPGRE